MTSDDFIIISLGFAAALWFLWDAYCRTPPDDKE